jgi:hypothetical protein
VSDVGCDAAGKCTGLLVILSQEVRDLHCGSNTKHPNTAGNHFSCTDKDLGNISIPLSVIVN